MNIHRNKQIFIIAIEENGIYLMDMREYSIKVRRLQFN